ncbi:MAG: PqqD family protein [Kiritimatiellae bacterium]|nr:PqqD family protein [Kiritimatiellia bacterium]
MSRRTIQDARRLEQLDIAELYATVPVQNGSVRRRDVGSGTILSVPLKKPRGRYALLAWLIPFAGERTIELDALGTHLFTRCDGRRTVRDLIEELRTAHALTFHEARLSVIPFLQGLLQRGAIAAVVPAPGPCANGRGTHE